MWKNFQVAQQNMKYLFDVYIPVYLSRKRPKLLKKIKLFLNRFKTKSFDKN